MNIEKLSEPVSAKVEGDISYLGNIKKEIKEIKNDIHRAKQSNDFNSLKRDVKRIDGIISDLERINSKMDYSTDVKEYRQMSAVLLSLGSVISLLWVVPDVKKMIDEDKHYNDSLIEKFMREQEEEEKKAQIKHRYFKEKLSKQAYSLTKFLGTTAIAGGAYNAYNAHYVNSVKKQFKKTIDTLKEMSKETKTYIATRGKSVKESVDDIKLEIYESCRYGDISEEEMEILLNMI